MAEPNHRQLLRRLQNDLAAIVPADEQGRQLLDETRAQIQRALEQDDQPDTLVERLQDTLYHFEGTHPDLTIAIGVVIDSLSNMGI